jgi:hypothetical protein
MRSERGLGFCDPETLSFSRLCILIVTYDRIEEKIPMIQARLEKLWAEYDRRTKEAA